MQINLIDLAKPSTDKQGLELGGGPRYFWLPFINLYPSLEVVQAKKVCYSFSTLGEHCECVSKGSSHIQMGISLNIKEGNARPLKVPPVRVFPSLLLARSSLRGLDFSMLYLKSPSFCFVFGSCGQICWLLPFVEEVLVMRLTLINIPQLFS